MRTLLVAAALLAAPLTSLPSAQAAERPVVVELFTSQGCSSCPPADAHLRQLAQERRDVLPLAFHVTYWNSLGWRDPYSLAAATERQAAYGSRLGETSFTPQAIVDGRTSLIGSRRSEVDAAIAEAKSQVRTAVPLAIHRAGAGLNLTVGAGSGQGRLLLIGFDREHTTAIGRGENGGRRLTEANIVRSLREVGSWRGAALTLAEAAPAGEDAALILQAPDGRILGAARL
ncbi:DUF1223 domain-containing protein [Methylobacterium gnaphalii]|uniref:DUF1223 domain-containing protein n=1 Tax=Methylobacterium gnaphalii TaxID=1010610 RepID=A0A512JHV7_9HYPH|nr:DUF1223 domain-containing protein [Methylobacterium gnaphalii]GEP09534.1 hypothetical protein MGN01_13790 [Methylobacterium gnaphalii]GJD69947.1 hypothetical protein MMMDOFMJ_2886 [Methylobacterium gnaphalii]GLS48168.1 hypothetical protein GCM10007885_10120 [Methylobacterium gnaphalii]